MNSSLIFSLIVVCRQDLSAIIKEVMRRREQTIGESKWEIYYKEQR
jgi:hypothetical protein